MKLSTAILVCACLTGCGSFVGNSDVPNGAYLGIDKRPTVADTSTVEVFKAGTPPNGQGAVVSGTSCKNKLWQEQPSLENAIALMKQEAVKLGMKAVYSVNVETGSASLATNCWASITATGVAYAKVGPVTKGTVRFDIADATAKLRASNPSVDSVPGGSGETVTFLAVPPQPLPVVPPPVASAPMFTSPPPPEPVSIYSSPRRPGCTNVGAVALDCEGSAGFQLGNQTYVHGPAGGLVPFNRKRYGERTYQIARRPVAS